MAESSYLARLESPTTAEYRMVRGQHVQVAAADVISTGLRECFNVVVSLETDPSMNCAWVSAVPGANGTFTLKAWKPTSTANPTPIAATSFGQVVSWTALGN